MSRNVTFAADDHLTRVLELDLSDEEDKQVTDMDTEVPEATVTFEFDESMRGQMDSANGKLFVCFIELLIFANDNLFYRPIMTLLMA